MPEYNNAMSTPPPEAGQVSGTLYVVATPIGNLDDLTPRARDTLASVALVAAEDTRVSRRLPGLDGPGRQWVSVNEHSEAKAIPRLLAALADGQSVALVSDAGTPLVSDPGYRLVDAAHGAGYTVSPLPGPCAAIAALSAAGLPSDRFCFEGFLPPRRTARIRRLQALASEPRTLIFYAPARDLGGVLADLATALGGQRLAAVARELTKLHETLRRDSLDALKDWVAGDANQQRGEAVVMVSGSDTPARTVELGALADALAEALPPSQAARLIAGLSGLSRQQAWALVRPENAPKDSDKDDSTP
ncbi:MAG: 16S rRNA (cytidine(1402)-2'-O)-methyltransferase [Wenzhouxiangella sp.]